MAFPEQGLNLMVREAGGLLRQGGGGEREAGRLPVEGVEVEEPWSEEEAVSEREEEELAPLPRRRLGPLIEARQRTVLLREREARRALQRIARERRREERIVRQQRQFEGIRLQPQRQWAARQETDRRKRLDLPTRS